MAMDKTRKDLNRSIADSLETEESLLPLMPELLQDLWAMGCSPELVVRLLKPLNLKNVRVLDLACGKGALAITLAREFGFEAVGIDANGVFLKEAEQKAHQFNVSHLCTFKAGDIREAVHKEKNYDLVTYASLGGLLGNYSQIVHLIRQTLRPGGYMLIDDGYLSRRTKIDRKGYEHYVPYEQTIQELTSCGDVIQDELAADRESKAINDQFLEFLKKRAEQIIAKKPRLQGKLRSYIKNQETECEVLERSISAAIWLIKKQN
jgi:ubiquinone/menaquinone biosynthesis C-methylase UbiE